MLCMSFCGSLNFHRASSAEKEALTAEGETGLLVPAPIDADSIVAPPFLPAPPERDLLDIQVEDSTEVENEIEAEEPVSGMKEFSFCSRVV